MDQHGSLAPDSLVLAVESATAQLSVALLGNGEVLCERSPEAPGQHAEQILPLIDSVLCDSGVEIGDPTAFAISIGPGSFTSYLMTQSAAAGVQMASLVAEIPGYLQGGEFCFDFRIYLWSAAS